VPKVKTHKGASGRLSISGRGKIMRRRTHVNNYRRKKSRRSKGQFDEMFEVHPSMRKKLRKLLPYGK